MHESHSTEWSTENPIAGAANWEDDRNAPMNFSKRPCAKREARSASDHPVQASGHQQVRGWLNKALHYPGWQLHAAQRTCGANAEDDDYLSALSHC